MAHGKTIRIYLADGSANGIRHAEVVNWTGQAIVCPRTRIGELSDWEESGRPGVYFLVGDDPDSPRPMVYVGEAENVQSRLKSHVKDARKDFFDRVVLFTSKDANLTKAHVKYLESRVVELVQQVDRATLANGNAPPRPSLPRADVDAMEEFLGPARLLLGALGFVMLQPLARSVQDGHEAGPSGPLAEVELRMTIDKRGVDSRGVSTDEGFVVLEGSIGSATVLQSLSPGWRAIRSELVEAGAFVVEGGRLRVTRDVLFSSPSAAASILGGGTRNGRKSWRDASGRPLQDLEDVLVGVADE